MIYQIDYKSGRPVYLQIVEQTKHAAATGLLKPGDPLPSIRPLAEKLRVNRNTVAKAYQELERDGVIETRAGKGCFLAAGASPLKKSYRRQMLNDAIDSLIVQAHHFQIPDHELLELVEQRLRQFNRERMK